MTKINPEGIKYTFPNGSYVVLCPPGDKYFIKSYARDIDTNLIEYEYSGFDKEECIILLSLLQEALNGKE